jgi:glycosyl transferase family 25
MSPAPDDAERSAAPASFAFLNGWADRLLVVSLRRAAERRARLALRLAGLRVELLDAVDKRDLDRDRLLREGVLDERRTRRAYRFREDMRLGAVGAALSHRACYERFLAGGGERLVVFEDDVVTRPDGLAALPDALGQLPPSWELCYLGYTLNEAPTARDRLKRAAYVALAPLGLSRWRPGEALRLLPRAFSPNLRRAGRHMCAHAYAVSRAGAAKLVAANTPVAYSADQLLAMMVLQGRLEAYVVDPIAFDQERMDAGADALPSEISGE